MKYLKPFFESWSYCGDLKENRDQIIDVLTKYCDLYDDSNTQKLWEFSWNVSDEFITQDEIDSADKMSNRIVTAIVDDLISFNNERYCRDFLDIYYDCEYALSNNSDEVTDNIRDIFLEYIDDKKAKFYKTSERSDNRYVVEITQDNILVAIDFNEIIGKLEQYSGLKKFDYSGNRNFIKFEFYESYPVDQLDDDDDD